jgi:hypothetical protein
MPSAPKIPQNMKANDGLHLRWPNTDDRQDRPNSPPQGKWSNIIYGTTSNLGDRPARSKERPSYLDGWLCPTRPKVSSIAAHQRGSPQARAATLRERPRAARDVQE